MPALTNDFISTIKNSSLASVIGLYEIFHRATLLISSTYRALEIYLAVAIFYLIVTTGLTYAQMRLESFLQRRI